MDIEEYIEHSESYDGFCTRCKEFTAEGGVEPDAVGYECPECGGLTVIGAEQALLMGLIEPQ
jgi:hypothetical protein